MQIIGMESCFGKFRGMTANVNACVRTRLSMVGQAMGAYYRKRWMQVTNAGCTGSKFRKIAPFDL
jgi:hypothetical protein